MMMMNAAAATRHTRSAKQTPATTTRRRQAGAGAGAAAGTALHAVATAAVPAQTALATTDPDAGGYVTPLPQQIEQLTRTDWWGHLQPTEQNSVRAESANLVSSLVTFGQSRISIGKALTMIQTVLEPHGVFVKYCANFNFSLTTAYRYMSIYRNARVSLPEVILREAMASGIDIVGSRDDRPLGQYTEAVAAAPPFPRNPTPEKARAWLAKVQEIKAEERKPPSRAGADTGASSGGAGDEDSAQAIDPETGLPNLAETDIEPRLKETYLVIRRVIRKLSPEVRGEFVAQLGGMAMTEFAIRGPMSIRPVAVPEDWLRSRGRPKVA